MSANSSSNSAAIVVRLRELLTAPTRLPLNAPNEGELEALRTSLSASPMRWVSTDLIKHVLHSAFFPQHDCVLNPFDLHLCTLPYGPSVRALSNLSGASKFLYALALSLRRGADQNYKQFAAALEYEERTRILAKAGEGSSQKHKAVESLLSELESPAFKMQAKNERREILAEYHQAVRNWCRDRNDSVDIVSDPMADIPQLANFNVELTGSILCQLVPGVSNLQKYWNAGQTRTLSLRDLFQVAPQPLHVTAQQLGCVLSHDPENLIALQLHQLHESVLQRDVADSISSCTNLQHLAVENCSAQLFAAACKLPNLISFKLEAPAFDAVTWAATQKGAICLGLRCLSVKNAGGHHWNSVLGNIRTFAKLEDLRLNFDSKICDEDDINNLLNAVKPLQHLRHLEIELLTPQASDILVERLPKSIRHLVIGSPMSEHKLASLLTGLEISNMLESLSLPAKLSPDVARSLQKWVARSDCSLKSLGLRSTVSSEGIAILFEGLIKNASLQALNLTFTEDSSGSDSKEGMDFGSLSIDTSGDEASDESGKMTDTDPPHLLLAKGLPRLCNLRHLYLETDFNATKIKEIAIAALQIASLRVLNLSSNRNLSEVSPTVFLKALKGNALLQEFLYTRKDGLRKHADILAIEEIETHLRNNRSGRRNSSYDAMTIDRSAQVSDMVAASVAAITTTTATTTITATSTTGGSTTG